MKGVSISPKEKEARRKKQQKEHDKQ